MKLDSFTINDDKNWCDDNAELRGPNSVQFLRTCFCSPGYEGDSLFHCEGKVRIRRHNIKEAFSKSTCQSTENKLVENLSLALLKLRQIRKKNCDIHL